MKEKPHMHRRDMLKTTAGLALSGIIATPFSVKPSFALDGGTIDINVITSASTLTTTLQQMLKDLKFDQDFGVRQTITQVTSGNQVIPALVSGQADIAMIVGLSNFFPAVERGASLRIVSAGTNLVQSVVYARDPSIKSLKDLEGRTVGSGAVGSLLHQLMVAALRKHGVDPSKVTFSNIGNGNDIFRAVAGGTVDAGPGDVGVYDKQKEFGVHALSDGELWIELPEFTYQGAYSSELAIRTKREGLVRLMAAYLKLYKHLQSPESKSVFVQSYNTAVSSDRTQEALTQWNFIQKIQPYAVDAVLSEERVLYLQELNKAFDMQKTIVPYDKCADMSMAKEANALLAKS